MRCILAWTGVALAAAAGAAITLSFCGTLVAAVVAVLLGA